MTGLILTRPNSFKIIKPCQAVMLTENIYSCRGNSPKNIAVDKKKNIN